MKVYASGIWKSHPLQKAQRMGHRRDARLPKIAEGGAASVVALQSWATRQKNPVVASENKEYNSHGFSFREKILPTGPDTKSQLERSSL